MVIACSGQDKVEALNHEGLVASIIHSLIVIPDFNSAVSSVLQSAVNYSLPHNSLDRRREGFEEKQQSLYLTAQGHIYIPLLIKCIRFAQSP